MKQLVVRLLALVSMLAIVAVGGTRLSAQGVDFTGELLGQNEPGGGDPDGYGGGAASFTSDTEMVWALDVANIELPAAAAHIHKGAAGENGPVVIPLAPPAADGKANGTATVDATLAADIKANPQGYYFNVHTSDYPQGAIRGQLKAGGGAPAEMPGTGADSHQQTLVMGLALLLLVAGISFTWNLRRRFGLR